MVKRGELKMFHEVPGVIYDVIYYNIVYFNKERIYERLKPYSEKDSEIFEYYYKFRKRNYSITPPDDFYPFFYVSQQEQSFITEYFRKNFKLDTGSYDSFFSILKNKSFMKRQLIFHFFEHLQDQINLDQLVKGQTDQVALAMIHLRNHGTKMRSFIRVFLDFNTLVDELIAYLNKLTQQVILFHDKYKSIYDATISNFCKKEVFNKYIKMIGMESAKSSEVVYSVCLFHPYIVLSQFCGDKISGILLGCSYSVFSRCLSGYLGNQGVPTHVNYRSIAYILSNKTLEDIVIALNVEDLTITQLSVKLYISRSTVDRMIGFLYDELAIISSRKTGTERYYRVNPNFFIAGKESISCRIDTLMEQWQRH